MSHSLLKEYISLLIEVGNPRVGNQLLSPTGKKDKTSKKSKKSSGKKKVSTGVSEFSAAGGGAIVGHVGGDSPGPKKEWS